MVRDRTDRARRPGAAEFANLEDIVAEVFASLAGEDVAGDEAAPRRAIEKRAGPQRRTVPERREPADVAEEAMERASSEPEEGVERTFADHHHPDPPANAELPVDELYSRTEALAIAAEDADFVRQAATWLATRSNAEQLLDRVRVAILEFTGPQHFGEGDPDTSRSSPEGEKGG